MMKKLFLGCSVLAILLALPACARNKDKKGKFSDPVVEQAADSGATEADLRRLAEREIAGFKSAEAGGEDRIIRKRPYYLKEYSVYSDTQDLSVTMLEKTSRSQPVSAEVRIAKERFFTKMHRERKVAIDDLDFLRDTGTEVISYELRGGHWRRTGSIFVADRTEAKSDGQWVQVDETTETQVPKQEQQPGWFSRTWKRLIGGD